MLRRIHLQDRYPLHWPQAPGPWLCSADQVRAWVAGDQAGDLLGHVALTRPEPGAAAQVWTTALGFGAERLLCVSRLLVAPQARGRGIGALLLSTAAAAARELGCHSVLEAVSLGPGDQHAVALYRRCGWREVGTVVHDWLPAGSQALLFVAPST